MGVLRLEGSFRLRNGILKVFEHILDGGGERLIFCILG